MRVLKFALITLAQLHDGLHVDFIKRGQHGSVLLGFNQRLATLARSRVIGTLRSTRSSSAPLTNSVGDDDTVAVGVAACAAGTGAGSSSAEPEANAGNVFPDPAVSAATRHASNI